MKKEFWINLLKVLFFGGLSYFLGEIQVNIPGIQGGIIDFREIILLISIFYFQHWIYLIVIVLITALGVPPGTMLFVLTSSHILSIIPVFYIYRFIISYKNGIYIQGLFFFITGISYYYLMIYPFNALLVSITGLNKGADFFTIYINSIKSPNLEILSTSGITTMAFIIYRFRRILQQRNIELTVAKNRAEESDRLKTAFLNNLSHEIRTPLNGIIGFASLITEEGYSKEETDQFKSYIQKNTNHLLKLIDKIIDLSRFDSEMKSHQQEWHGLKTIIDNTLNTIKEDSSIEKNIKVEFFVQTDPALEELIIFTNPEHIKEIIVNLVQNAFNYTQKGYVKLNLKKTKDIKLHIEVEDTGIGIAQSEKERIFERFYRIDDVNSSIRGIGLGLTLTKKLVETLKGKIWFDSTINVGTKFYVELPMRCKRDETKAPLETNNQKLQKNVLNGAKILVAEDDETNFFYLKEVLTKESYEVTRANNGYEAVEIMQEINDFNVVLMDIKMPLLDGLSATKLIRDFNKDIPIIAQTAFALERDKNEALAAGCTDYLSKPINKNKLISLLKQYI